MTIHIFVDAWGMPSVSIQEPGRFPFARLSETVDILTSKAGTGNDINFGTFKGGRNTGSKTLRYFDSFVDTFKRSCYFMA